MERIVIASDSFKGSLGSRAVAEAAAQAVRAVFPGCEVVCLDVADGGEGTMEALYHALGGERVSLLVRGPLGDPVTAEYLRLPEGGEPAAVIEMAQASGLVLVPPEERNPLKTSSFGTGELMLDALRGGCRRFLVGLGGSATNDAGIGMLAALGWRFLDRDGRPLPPVGASLGAVAAIDDTAVDPRLKALRFEVACDVDTPFCGPSGAAAVFAPQKGADAAMVAELEAGMCSFAAVIEQFTGVDVRSVPGAGAAGGLGGALHAFLGAELVPGAELVLRAAGFDDLLAGADLVITGEGHLDAQTARGKLPQCVLAHARAASVPVLAITGALDRSPAVDAMPFRDILCIHPPGFPRAQALLPDVTRQHVYETVRRYLQNLRP